MAFHRRPFHVSAWVNPATTAPWDSFSSTFTGALQECSRHIGPLGRPMISFLPPNSCQTSIQEKAWRIPTSSPHINVGACFPKTRFFYLLGTQCLHSPLEMEDTLREPLKPSVCRVSLPSISCPPPCLWFQKSHLWGQRPLSCSKTSTLFSPGPIPPSWMILVDIYIKAWHISFMRGFFWNLIGLLSHISLHKTPFFLSPVPLPLYYIYFSEGTVLIIITEIFFTKSQVISILPISHSVNIFLEYNVIWLMVPLWKAFEL